MLNVRTLLMASLTALSLATPTAALAAEHDPMACIVTVNYTLNNVSRLAYTKEFVVGLDAPFTDDFSTATRLRSFDATLSVESGDPVVSATFFADVSTFNGVGFQASLRVRDEAHGETTSGRTYFYSSVAGAAGTHLTTYSMTCERAK